MFGIDDAAMAALLASATEGALGAAGGAGAAEAAGIGGAAAMSPALMEMPLSQAAPMTQGMGDPGVGAMAEPGAIKESTTGGPLDWDWKGAADKAEKFIKLSKTVQDFGAAMKGEPSPAEQQKLSQVAPMQQSQPYQQRPAPQQQMPQTRMMQDPRLRQY